MIINKLDINVLREQRGIINFDFFIDSQQLSPLLGFNRLETMEFADFDLDYFKMDEKISPDYKREDIIKIYLKRYLGIEIPRNQFGTERLVLYRCHCGCDYCGIISCNIVFEEKFVLWKDIRYENRPAQEHEDINPIDLLRFHRKEYFDAFNQYDKLLEEYIKR